MADTLEFSEFSENPRKFGEHDLDAAEASLRPTLNHKRIDLSILRV